jgi:hypothetical protein
MSSSVARHPKKPKKGEVHRLHVLLSGELVTEVDELAAAMTAGRPPGDAAVTRTDVARMAIHAFIASQRKRTR